MLKDSPKSSRPSKETSLWGEKTALEDSKDAAHQRIIEANNRIRLRHPEMNLLPEKPKAPEMQTAHIEEPNKWVVLGVAVFFGALTYIVVHALLSWLLGSLLSSLIGVVAAGGVFWITPQILVKFMRNTMPEKEDSIPDLPEGMTKAEVWDIIGKAKSKVSQISTASLQLAGYPAKTKLDEICKTANAIFDAFLKNPKHIKEAKNFLNRQLDQTVDVVTKFLQVRNQTISVEKLKKTTADFEELLDVINASFKKQYDKIMSDDYLNLEVDMEVLKKTIDM